jgi:hypothetical protein
MENIPFMLQRCRESCHECPTTSTPTTTTTTSGVDPEAALDQNSNHKTSEEHASQSVHTQTPKSGKSPHIYTPKSEEGKTDLLRKTKKRYRAPKSGKSAKGHAPPPPPHTHTPKTSKSPRTPKSGKSGRSAKVPKTTTHTPITTITKTPEPEQTPTDVLLYYLADCVDGETDFATIAADTVKDIDEKIEIGLWQGEPYGECGSIIVTLTAVSETAAIRIKNHIFDTEKTGGICVEIDGETYCAECIIVSGILSCRDTQVRLTSQSVLWHQMSIWLNADAPSYCNSSQALKGTTGTSKTIS